MPFAALRARYATFAGRVLASLSEVERRDVNAFDDWFYRRRGWTSLPVIVGSTTALAWAASRLSSKLTFAETAIVSNVVVLTLLWAGLSAWFGHRKFAGRLMRLALLVPLLATAGALVGASLATWVKHQDPLAWLQDGNRAAYVLAAGLALGWLYALVLVLIAGLRNREYAARAARLEAEVAQGKLAQQLAESRLKLLQLQIEPHFLFNTLGSAKQLAEKGAPAAARLIGDLISFLRAATPSARSEATTLRQEADLAAAYLAIMRTRLGPRLEWRVDIPAELEPLAIPPGMLITLVENAIKHGIEPAPDGGSVTVRASRTGEGASGRLAVAVADTGAGLAAAPGQGIGLANIRERLALLFGGQAALVLEENAPRGFVATLVLPPARAAGGAPSSSSRP